MIVGLRALPYWARIGSAIAVVGAAYFFTSAVVSGLGGDGASDVLFDLLLAGAFALLTAAMVAKAVRHGVLDARRSGPLDY
jgi:hypothetical protein